MIYEKNLSQLKYSENDIYEKICDPDFCWDEGRSVIEYAKNGEPVLVYIQEDGTKEYLGSRYNPTQEAEKFMADCVDLPEKATLVLVGFGNGAHIREFMSKSKKKDTNCIVFEPCKDLFMRILHDIDISDILKDERVHIVVNDMNNKMASIYAELYISLVNKKTNTHIALPKYCHLFSEICDRFLDNIKNKYEDIKVEENTIRMYGKIAANNGIQNLCYLPGCYSSAKYIDKFPKDLPGIVVAAGPSLEKNVEMLKKAKGRALIIAVDTAAKTVMSHGIIPDMVISIDSRKPVQLFDVKGLEKVPFLAEMAMNTDVLDFLNPEKLIFYSADSPTWDDLFREAGSEIRQIYAGGTVAIDAMANLIEWGFKTIILVGQDLMITDNKYHAGEKEIRDMSELPYRVVEVKDIYGKEGYTTADFAIYIREIAKIAERFDVKFIDATEGGALIENTEIMTLQDAINEYCQKECDINRIINENHQLFVGEQKTLPLQKLQEMKEHLMFMKGMLEQGISACEKGWTLLEHKQYDVSSLKEINALLEEVDAQYADFEEGVYVLKCASDGYFEFEDDFYMVESDHIQEAIRMYKKSAAYYKSIADAIPRVVDMVEQAIERWHKMHNET
mgnify:FL=1